MGGNKFYIDVRGQQTFFNTLIDLAQRSSLEYLQEGKSRRQEK